MKKLFVFQDKAGLEYQKELEHLYKICQKDDTANVQKETIDKLSADYLSQHAVEIVISNGLPKEWYLIISGLKIVTVTLDKADQYHGLADIVIDFKSRDSNRYCTGSEYAISDNQGKTTEVLEIIDLIKKMDWDSDFWGIPVAYLSSRYLTENIIAQTDKFIRKEKIGLVEYLCNCHDDRSVKIAEKNGFHFTDIRLTFEKTLKEKNKVDLDEGFAFNLARESDISGLKEISKNLYKDSRYFFDSNFEVNKVSEFYRSWVEKAVHGTFDHESYCLYYHNNPIGFCTIRYSLVNTAHIGLFGMAGEHQGKGLSRKLLYLVCNKLIDKGITQFRVITQGRNYSAQRLYQSVGFLTKSTELWYHKWI